LTVVGKVGTVLPGAFQDHEQVGKAWDVLMCALQTTVRKQVAAMAGNNMHPPKAYAQIGKTA
jgi:hypothetical protein